MKKSNNYIKYYQRFLERMTGEYLNKVIGKSPMEIKHYYEKSNNEWLNEVQRQNLKYGVKMLDAKSWENIWLRDGYVRVIANPYDLKTKTELLRIIKVLENKTEVQWKLREMKYKIIFVFIKLWFYIKNPLKIFKR